MKDVMLNRFSLADQVVIITGGAGLLGSQHAQAVVEAGGIPILLDVNEVNLNEVVTNIKNTMGIEAHAYTCDITKKHSIVEILNDILLKFGRIDALVNNAANDPKVGSDSKTQLLTRFENLTEENWLSDLSVGLTGAFFCCQIFGHYMASCKKGVIVNIASDLAVIAPDQRLYLIDGLPCDQQPVKPVTYSVVKTGLVGLTRYLATYWANDGIRVNALSPGGVFNNQHEEFVARVSQKIPLGRMAQRDEYMATLIYLLSDASKYMTGFNLVIDGGRSIW